MVGVRQHHPGLLLWPPGLPCTLLAGRQPDVQRVTWLKKGLEQALSHLVLHGYMRYIFFK